MIKIKYQKKKINPWILEVLEIPINDAWVPEKNATTGFTIKGMGILLLIIAIFSTIRYLFF